ncbi:MAG: cupin-like domain-containing protein [Pseudomonadota bacterium]
MSVPELSSVDSVSNINSEDFVSSYFTQLRPLVIKDLSKLWPASSKWTPNYFSDQYGNKHVKVYDASFVAAGKNYMSNAQTIPFRDYIDRVMNKSQDLRMFLYNIKSEIPELVSDIQFPDLVKGLSKNFIFMFFGAKGSVTQMHFDIDMSHVFHTAMYGKKTVYLFPYEQGKNLHRYPFTCRSYVDIEKPDTERFPNLKSLKGYKVVIEKGDTLYIPAGYWHHFVYDEAGFAISLRCANRTLLGKCQGFYNLIIMQSIDRVMNKLMPTNWFNWKQQQALKASPL